MSRLPSPPFRTAPHASRREALRLLSLAGLTALLPGTAASAADFEAFVQGLWPQAQAAGVSRETFETATAGLRPETAVLAKPKAQAEFTISIPAYLGSAVTNSRVARGRAVAAQYATPLARALQRHGVPGEIIVAILGVESNFGVGTGGADVLRVLATLAWKGHRAETFIWEFVDALVMLEKGYATRGQLRGSWAGAMGQSQFMPSSFVQYAQDFDGDGRRDIWTTPADVFASIAQYLKAAEWRDDQTWGREVQLPADYQARAGEWAQPPAQHSCSVVRHHTQMLPLAQWQQIGVRRIDGSDLPTNDFVASIIQPDGPQGRAFLTYQNFRAILRYSCANNYALSIGHLADRLAGY